MFTGSKEHLAKEFLRAGGAVERLRGGAGPSRARWKASLSMRAGAVRGRLDPRLILAPVM